MIVPENEGIAVEAALPNKDAGFVRPGQAVEIKVGSFPFTRYGTVPGTVQTVSGDAVQGPDSDPTQRRPGASGAGSNSSTGQTAEGQGRSIRCGSGRWPALSGSTAAMWR